MEMMGIDAIGEERRRRRSLLVPSVSPPSVVSSRLLSLSDDGLPSRSVSVAGVAMEFCTSLTSSTHNVSM